MVKDKKEQQINQDLFRYNLIKDKYNLELEQLKNTNNASRTLFNTSIAILTIEITLITGLIIQNLDKIQQINYYIKYGIIIFIIAIIILTLSSILNFYKAKHINEIVTPIGIEDIKIFYKEKKQFDEEIYFTIEATQKATYENYLIIENKIKYIEKGSSRLMITIVLLTIFLIILTIIII